MPHRLYNGSDAFAWHARRWPQFAEAGKCIAIQPVYSTTDWGMGRPLDAEEVVAAAVLDRALEHVDKVHPFLVLPPFRFTPRQSRMSAFSVDIEAAHEGLEAVLRSAASSGLERFILFNSSPLLEEWVDVAARDMRVRHDLQLFCINLSGVGLDFHPIRGGRRSGLDAALTCLLGVEPMPEEAPDVADLDPLPDAAVKTKAPIEADPSAGEDVLTSAATLLVRLLAEIREHPMLQAHHPDPKESE